MGVDKGTSSLYKIELKYRWTSLFERDKDQKNCLAYNKFAYKKTKNDYKLEDRPFKKG
jgi:hypothetical protein